MSEHDDLRERVARALCLANGVRPDALDLSDPPVTAWHLFCDEADAALAVLLPALDALRAERDEARKALAEMVNLMRGPGYILREVQVISGLPGANTALTRAIAALGARHD